MNSQRSLITVFSYKFTKDKWSLDEKAYAQTPLLSIFSASYSLSYDKSRCKSK